MYEEEDVVVGKTYFAKVSENVVKVRITGESPYGGWYAKNEATGCDVRIRSAQRLRGEATA